MKGLIEEYGGIILLSIICTLLFTAVYGGINVWYSQVFPELSRDEMELVDVLQDEPILIVKPIELKLGTKITEAICGNYIKAYTNSSKDRELPVKVSGLSSIDNSKYGPQQLLYLVEGDNGLQIGKKGVVLFY